MSDTTDTYINQKVRLIEDAVQQATARRCAEIATEKIIRMGQGATFAAAVAREIEREFGL
jgi:hypothetical protein